MIYLYIKYNQYILLITQRKNFIKNVNNVAFLTKMVKIVK